MRYELWFKDKGGTTHLHSSDDPGELYVMYKDATEVYDSEDLILTVAEEGAEVYPISVTWLRRAILMRDRTPVQ
jgi:hypothetical protein